MTASLDLNLLHALDALLQEGSVTRAAARAHLTTPAMSRALGRLRETLADPLLVRAGRNMVLTPFATSIQPRVQAATFEARTVLAPAVSAPIATLERTFVVRCSDAVAAVLASPLHGAAEREAPSIRFRFVPEGEEEAAPLRDGHVDLDIGVVDLTEPELMTRLLLRDHFVGVVRRGHPLARGRMSAQRFASFAHIVVSRRGRAMGPVDVALGELGLRRDVSVVVPTFFTALFAAASSNLVTAVPGELANRAQRLLALHLFPLPVEVPPLTIAQVWHPRLDRDPAHRWLRDQIQLAIGHDRTSRGPAVPGRKPSKADRAKGPKRPGAA